MYTEREREREIKILTESEWKYRDGGILYIIFPQGASLHIFLQGLSVSMQPQRILLNEFPKFSLSLSLDSPMEG